MNVLILVYTLCTVPVHFTVISDAEVTLWKANMESAIAIDKKFDKDKIQTLKIPLDNVTEGNCA